MSELKKNFLTKGKLITAAAIVLLGIALIPNFVRARREAEANTCINYMVQINAAKFQWALDHHAKPGDIVTANDLAPYFPNGKIPKCPAGGTYSLGVVVPFYPLVPMDFPFTNGQYQEVTCSLGTNVTPPHIGPWDYHP